MTIYAEAIAQADHRVAIGATDLTLSSPEGIDWSQCVGAEASGGSMPPDVLFTFSTHGLRLRWYIELRERDARVAPSIDVETVGRVLALLPDGCAARLDFGALLRNAASDLERHADASISIAQRFYGAAATLRKLAPEGVEIPF